MYTEKKLKLRWANKKDLDFVSRTDQIAMSEPYNECFWSENLRSSEIKTTPLEFITAYYKFGATNWGTLEDFVILEKDGVSVAAVSIYPSPVDDFRPLKISQVNKLAAYLKWTPQEAEKFITKYELEWGPNKPFDHIRPIAPIVIETVAVPKEFRGLGYGVLILTLALEIVKKMGFDSVEGGYVIGNHGAEKAYIKAGFKHHTTYHPDYFNNGYWGCVRLIAKLNEFRSNKLEMVEYDDASKIVR